MKYHRGVWGVPSIGAMVMVGIAGSGCSSSSQTTQVKPAADAGADTSVPVTKKDAAATSLDAAPEAFTPPTWSAGDGATCAAPSGGFPSSVCDPSDEQAQGCQGGLDAGCAIDPKCGSTKTCEPFTTNPAPGAGVMQFRMRVVDVASPATLSDPTVQQLVLVAAVDIPAAPYSCGESGSGYWNWLLSVDKAKGTVTTGGAPPSDNPIDTGYCYADGMFGTTRVKPITVQATFKGDTFWTKPASDVLELPVFVHSGGSQPDVVLFPMSGLQFNEVSISDNGNCIGQINPNASIPVPGGSACGDSTPLGPDTCSRWHPSGALGAYIKLETADTVLVTQMTESLCVLLLGSAQSDNGNPAKCVAGSFNMGNFNSSTLQPCSAGSGCDSVWMSMNFAASAVKVTSGSGVSLCSDGGMPVKGT